MWKSCVFVTTVHSIDNVDHLLFSINIRFAATTAFLNALEFIRGNFEKQDDRNYIMTVICQATQCVEKRVCIFVFSVLFFLNFIYLHFLINCY